MMVTLLGSTAGRSFDRAIALWMGMTPSLIVFEQTTWRTNGALDLLAINQHDHLLTRTANS